MNKIAIFGSVALLLSIPCHLFTAECAAELANQRNIAERKEGVPAPYPLDMASYPSSPQPDILTPGNTRYRLHTVILPSIEECRSSTAKSLDTFFNGAKTSSCSRCQYVCKT